MFHVPENNRIKTGVMKSDSSYGNNGCFQYAISNRTMLYIIASDGEGWEHVSVHCASFEKDRTPTWSEMCKIKDLFWDEEDCVVQFLPPKSEYVNLHPHTLHLWRKIGEDIITPPKILIG